MKNNNQDNGRKLERIVLYLIIIGFLGFVALRTVRIVSATSDSQDLNVRYFNISPIPADKESPYWYVPDDMTVSTDPLQATAVVSYSATAFDNVGVTSSNCTPAPGSTFPLATTTVNCTAFDAAGNVGNASFNVTVVDNETPSLTPPADITTNNDPSQATAVVNFSPTASDNVGVTSLSCIPASGSAFSIGTTTVNCTASDAAGNTANASFDVTVVDNQPPSLTPPADITATNDPGQATAVVNFSPAASDNVGVTSLSCIPASGSAFSIGTTTVNCTATDAAGNTANASFNVTVVDDEAPTWTLPGDMTAGTDPGVATADVNYTATATDNAGITSSSCTPASGSTFALGTTAVNCTATDAAGNTGNASFNVTVIDNEAPTWSVPADVTVSTDPGLATAVVNYSATATDNAGVTSSTCTPASGSTFPLGTTAVNCTASDVAGNTGNASFNMTVVDTEAPTWSVPADITAVATSLSGAVVSYAAMPSDNVGVTSSSCTPASGSTFSLGTTTVNCAAADAAGNSGNASFDVIVGVDTGSIGTLEEEIENMNLPNGVEKNLLGPLHQAQELAEDNNPDNDGAVCNKLNEFLLHAQNELAEGHLTQTEADVLSAFAQAILDGANCT